MGKKRSKVDNKPNIAIVKYFYPDGKEEEIQYKVGTIDRQVIEEGEAEVEYVMPFLSRVIEKE